VVEPWATHYLHLVHWATRRPALRRLSPPLDALASMIAREEATYRNWLSRPADILAVLTEKFHTESCRLAWGKLAWRGRKPLPA